jgi:very-short-patch-repair endonuclease
MTLQISEEIKQRFDNRVADFLRRVRSDEESLTGGWLTFCESPIEQLLGIELAYLEVDGFAFGKSMDLRCLDAPLDVENLERYCPNGVDRFNLLFAQPQIANYRVDFLILSRYRGDHQNIKRLIIECDGHEYHERTREQAARDKQRSNELQYHGFKVFRYTGSQIYNNARGCAADVKKHIERPSAEIRAILRDAQDQ